MEEESVTNRWKQKKQKKKNSQREENNLHRKAKNKRRMTFEDCYRESWKVTKQKRVSQIEKKIEKNSNKCLWCALKY